MATLLRSIIIDFFTILRVTVIAALLLVGGVIGSFLLMVLGQLIAMLVGFLWEAAKVVAILLVLVGLYILTTWIG